MRLHPNSLCPFVAMKIQLPNAVDDVLWGLEMGQNDLENWQQEGPKMQ